VNYLITGGAGFIGSRIARRLRAQAVNVAILDNLSIGCKENIPEGCRFVKGDINDPSALRQAMEGADAVIHQAAFVSIRGSFDHPEFDLRENSMGALTVFRMAGEMGVRRVVFASSMGVYSEPRRVPVSEDNPVDPPSPYGLSKLHGEMFGRIMAKQYGFSFIALRQFNTYGTAQTPSDYVGVITIFIQQVLSGQPMTVFGDGEQRRDLVWVEDVAQANVLAANSSEEGVFNIGSGTDVSIKELALAIQRIMGGEIIYKEGPPGDIRLMCADITRAKTRLGYKPSGVLEEQLPAIVDYWRKKR
jgi:UDP-glucose 4-epimerase